MIQLGWPASPRDPLFSVSLNPRSAGIKSVHCHAHMFKNHGFWVSNWGPNAYLESISSTELTPFGIEHNKDSLVQLKEDIFKKQDMKKK